MSREVPSDIRAEESLLGAILLRPTLLNDLRDTLDVSDFFRGTHQLIYRAMLSLHSKAEPIDVVTVASATKGDEVDPDVIVQLMANTPSVSNAFRYADSVIDCARRRRSITFWLEMVDDAYNVGNDFDAVLARSDASADRLIAPRAAEIADLHLAGDFVEAAEMRDRDRPWLIPHIAKSMWRILIVAGEGIGKAVLMRFLAIHAATGRDPWYPTRFVTPRRCLYVECENASASVAHQFRIANKQLGVTRSLVEEAQEQESLWIWHREQGLNLRDRKPQAEFEATLQRCMPEIVFMGPLRKLFRRSSREDQEQVALEVQDYLDGLRKRYGFALVLEHHAPHGDSRHGRDYRPFGSSAWMGWPEFGITLEPRGNVTMDDTEYVLDIGRFRRDREIADWPQTIERTVRSAYAWVPRWNEGRHQRLIDNDVPYGDELDTSRGG